MIATVLCIDHCQSRMLPRLLAESIVAPSVSGNYGQKVANHREGAVVSGGHT